MSLLDGRRVLVLTTNYGTDERELRKPVEALREAGARVTVAAQEEKPVRTLVSDREPGAEIAPDTVIADVEADEFDAVVVPGGTVNADTLRTDEDARRLVTAFAEAGKPVAAICHGPWLLADAGLVTDREVTSYPSLRQDLSRAGGSWIDRKVVVDTDGGFPLITSRRPGDLDAFSSALVQAVQARSPA
ncbi:type 1 glutamine amidotransferase domain-containing protein [Streptomyces sp. CC208A]|uniref:type 1 glutamine amidotransferase domain-containing protein n=1 Tax=Streptomyces sp. CC208A TaxID=3044573 RepID=UPI0024A856A4|nr:type 1 glutamine amidotransferase domain-containing protein [Streptomyces sp. CC208A]